MTAKKSETKLGNTLQAFGRRSFDEKAKKSSDAVVAKVIRNRQVSIEQFLVDVRAREPRLYESSTRSVDRWAVRKKLYDTVAPDGFPYAAGPKVPKKLSLTEIITEYKKDLAS